MLSAHAATGGGRRAPAVSATATTRDPGCHGAAGTGGVNHPGSARARRQPAQPCDVGDPRHDVRLLRQATGDFAALGLPVAGDDPSAVKEGFGIQEIELAATAAIDPYLEGAIFLTIPNLEGLEVEEGYLVTTSLPANLQIKAGTFRSQVGRNNAQHLHQQNFTRRPLMTALLFGVPTASGGRACRRRCCCRCPGSRRCTREAFSIGPPEDPALVATFGGGARSTPRT